MSPEHELSADEIEESEEASEATDEAQAVTPLGAQDDAVEDDGLPDPAGDTVREPSEELAEDPSEDQAEGPSELPSGETPGHPGRSQHPSALEEPRDSAYEDPCGAADVNRGGTAPEGPADAAPEDPAVAPAEDVRPTAADAFDMLHARHAPSLTRQAFLLCGHRGLARRAVTHAFRLAWQRWPEVAVDADPAGWVRVAAYQYALAPWRHFRVLRVVRHRRAMRSVPPGDRTLLDALLRLPNSYRAPLLLCDGLGLSLADTAAEVEAGTAATAGRLRHARAAIAERVPELGDAAPDQLPARTSLLVRQLTAPQPASPPPARRVRRGSALRTWCSTAAGLGLAVAVAGTAFAVVSSDGERNVTPLPVPKHPSATLAPGNQPGRLLPMI